MKQKEISARHYKMRKQNKLCQRCGNPLNGSNKSYCEECAIKVRKYQRDNRKFYLSIGVCPICRKNPLYGDERSCPECRASRKQYKYNTEEQLEKNRRKSRAIYSQCIEKGVCTRCRKRKAVYNRKKCEICLEKDRVYQALRRN